MHGEIKNHHLIKVVRRSFHPFAVPCAHFPMQYLFTRDRTLTWSLKLHDTAQEKKTWERREKMEAASINHVEVDSGEEKKWASK